MKFRSKPVVIEAIQFLGGFSIDEMRVEWGEPFARTALYNDKMNDLLIATLEGAMRADLEDWIIKGTRGEFYPCKPDVFQTKYEAA